MNIRQDVFEAREDGFDKYEIAYHINQQLDALTTEELNQQWMDLYWWTNEDGCEVCEFEEGGFMPMHDEDVPAEAWSTFER